MPASQDTFRAVEAEDVAMCMHLDPRVDSCFHIPSSGRHYTAVWANEDVGFGEAAAAADRGVPISLGNVGGIASVATG